MTWKTYENKLVFRLVPKQDVLGQPSAMMIYQPEMEAVIRENALKYESLDVRFGHTFVDIAQDDAGVTLSATDAEGKPYTIRVRYVIGADGGSSPLRQASGREMVGETRPRRWVVIDGEVKNFWPECNELVFWSDPVLPVVDIPLAKGNHRWEIPLGEGEKDADYDSEELLWGRLNKLGITEHNVRIKGWAFYSHHVRHLEDWRSDRAVFIGDASHLMPPWAGQGMQSGIRDAQNLAWKYEFVTKGLIEDGILDTIQSERAPHVATMTEMAVNLGKLVEADKPGFVKARNALGPILMHIPAVQNALTYSSDQNRFENGWVTGKPTSKNALGRMIPQPEVYDSRGRLMLLDHLLGQGFIVLGLEQDPRLAMTDAQIKDWERLGARFLAVVGSSAKVATSDIVVDHTGMLHDWMKRFKTSVLVLRPDRFVAAANPTGLDVPAARGNLAPAVSAGRRAAA